MSVAELEQALQSRHPLVTLRELLQQAMIEDNLSRAEMLEALGELRANFQAQGNARGEDIVLEAMDFVSGWCSPHMKIRGAA